MAEPRRVAFLGIGHPLRRDDAAGVEVCDRLRPALRGRREVLVVSGGSAPENCVGGLRAFGPEVVVVIDAACMGQAPGTVLRIDPADPRLDGASTHTMPLPAFCKYLGDTLGCEVVLLGIEPVDTSFGEGLSPEVEEAVERSVREVLRELSSRNHQTFARPHLPASPAEVRRFLMQGEGKGVGVRRPRRQSKTLACERPDAQKEQTP